MSLETRGRHPLHRDYHDKISVEWNALALLADVPGVQLGDKFTDVWNRIAASVGMPAKTDDETLTAEEWNEAVNRATARHDARATTGG